MTGTRNASYQRSERLLSIRERIMADVGALQGMMDTSRDPFERARLLWRKMNLLARAVKVSEARKAALKDAWRAVSL